MFRSNTLIGEKGVIIHYKDGKRRMATQVEKERIKSIENEVLEQLSCKTKAVVFIKDIHKLFVEKVSKRLIAEGMNYIHNYYQGYYIESFDKSEAISIDDSDVTFAKINLKKDVIERLSYMGHRINNITIDKEYNKTVLGEPMLMDIRCNKDFVKHWEQLISYFML